MKLFNAALQLKDHNPYSPKSFIPGTNRLTPGRYYDFSEHKERGSWGNKKNVIMLESSEGNLCTAEWVANLPIDTPEVYVNTDLPTEFQCILPAHQFDKEAAEKERIDVLFNHTLPVEEGGHFPRILVMRMLPEARPRQQILDSGYPSVLKIYEKMLGAPLSSFDMEYVPSYSERTNRRTGEKFITSTMTCTIALVSPEVTE